MNRLVSNKYACSTVHQVLNKSGHLRRTSILKLPRDGRQGIHNAFADARINYLSLPNKCHNSIVARGAVRNLFRRELPCATFGPNLIESRYLSSGINSRHYAIWNWSGGRDGGFSESGGNNSRNNDGGENGGEGEGSAGEGGGEGEAPPPPPPPPIMTSLAPVSVPETFSPVPVIAVHRSPVFPKFIKIVEVSAFYYFYFRLGLFLWETFCW